MYILPNSDQKKLEMEFVMMKMIIQHVALMVETAKNQKGKSLLQVYALCLIFMILVSLENAKKYSHVVA